MSTQIRWQDLVVRSITAPKDAAQTVLSWRLPPAFLWQALALVAIVNAILSTLSNMVVPVSDTFSSLLLSPVVFAMIVAGGLIATVYVLTWIGKLLGGTGGFHDMLTLLIWLQVLRALAQVVLLVLLVSMPVVATFFVLFVAVATLWIFINFVQVGLGLASLGQAVAVVIASAAGVILGLSMILSLLGVTIGGPAGV
jgi:hypothetical protein